MAEGGGQRQDHIHSGALLTLQESKTLIFHARRFQQNLIILRFQQKDSMFLRFQHHMILCCQS